MRGIDKRKCKQLAESGEALPVTGAEEAKVTHFNKTFGPCTCPVQDRCKTCWRKRRMNSSARRVQVLRVPVSEVR